jgi:CHAD domain-containing protein
MTILCQAPSYLQNTPWVDFELARGRDLSLNLSKQLKRLRQKSGVEQVHDARVALRRWLCVWDILKTDGWQSGKFKRRYTVKLSSLRKDLGKVRDWDVCLDFGRQYNLSTGILRSWKRKRRQALAKVYKHLRRLPLKELAHKLDKYLVRRSHRIKRKIDQTSWIYPSAYDHLVIYLRQREESTRQLEAVAQTVEELHRLRLAIKDWRYFLTELFGLTNLELVKAQQYLGQIHDLERLDKLLSGQTEFYALTKIRAEKNRLLQEFNQLRQNLPYGLKPQEISLIS